MDRVDKKTRSNIMRSVKSKGNRSTELALIKLFKTHGVKGWRRNYKLHGKPDFVFPKQRIALFADGCFWHGCFCRTNIPKTNSAYWERKIARNVARDLENNGILRDKGWQVFRVKECEIKRGELPASFLTQFG